MAMMHWGKENTATPTDSQRNFARDLAKAGCSLIAGSGPHQLQPVEFIGSTPVFYSLGNLVFDGPAPSPAWSRGALLQIEIDGHGKLVRNYLLPIAIQENGTAEPLENN